MKFVKTDDLKIGMRLAKPIFNQRGVLLYERGSELTSQGIASVQNFKLIGIYVLEPAEPLPPYSEDDMEFEKFQMVSVFTVRDELQLILTKGKVDKIYNLAEDIVRNYGRLDRKINFIQNLRSPDDYVYKHSLNVAILTAMIMNKLNAKLSDRLDAVVAALVHDVGKLKLNQRALLLDEPQKLDPNVVRAAQLDGIRMAEDVFYSNPIVKRAMLQAFKRIMAFEDKTEPEASKFVEASRALSIAEIYDSMTAMNADGEPQSEVAVLKLFRNNPKYFDKQVVNALFSSINILNEGSCVELSNGEKALVISTNDYDVLKPTVLCFSTNTIVDLSMTGLYSDLEITDIMKTLDNRHVMGDDIKAMLNQD